MVGAVALSFDPWKEFLNVEAKYRTLNRSKMGEYSQAVQKLLISPASLEKVELRQWKKRGKLSPRKGTSGGNIKNKKFKLYVPGRNTRIAPSP